MIGILAKLSGRSMNIVEELSCGGVAPTGPVSAWPQERHFEIFNASVGKNNSTRHATRVQASVATMAKGLLGATVQAAANGKVSQEIRDERYETCKSCPFFVEESKRCSECGCFMEAKTWIGGNPDHLCPKKKWSR